MGLKSILLSTSCKVPFLLLLATLFAYSSKVARADGYDNLPVVKPIRACADLAKTDLSKIAKTPVALKSAETVSTGKGPFCKVTTEIAPEILVTIYLPVDHWTQRYFQGRGGDDPTAATGFTEAATCQPALNGEFVYGLSNVKFTMVIGTRRGVSPGFVPDLQKILDYSYRGNHVAALVAKALIKAYYGQPPRYSYFVGCSDGGRQGLMEAQRYPTDFDAIGAGSPGVISTAQESTFHLWKVQADQRADGTNILMPEKVKLLQTAVAAHCDTQSGVKDGLLQDPNACHFEAASLQCPATATDKSGCFTQEEVIAIQKLYDGAHDNQGHYFYFGMPRGSEGLWNLPAAPTAEVPSAATHATQLAYILLPEVTPSRADYKTVPISKADFERASIRSPMFDAANTDLRGFAAHGGKLILWHGLVDTLIPPRATLVYYEGVQRFMGSRATDKFLRAFFPPGVGHCGGGDGYTQLDILSALMEWRERQHSPTEILTGKTEPSKTHRENIVQDSHVAMPYAVPSPPLIATRPLYPYPYIAHYTGKGDPKDASSYTRAMSTAKPFPDFSYEAVNLIGPDNQHDYDVKEGRIVSVPKH